MTKISRFDKDKDGQPLKTRDGRPYTRVLINTEQYEKGLSGFENQDTKNWNVGDEVEVEVEKKGDYLNFKTIKAQDKSLAELDGKIEDILNKITGIGLRIGVLADYIMENNPKKKTYPVNDAPMPFEDITPLRPDEEPPF